MGTKQSEGGHVVIWQYSGRRGGWWAYETGHQTEIDDGYAQFTDSLKRANDGNQDSNSNQTKIENDDDEDDEGLSNEIVIEIGVREYVIDFAQMIQYDQQNPKRQRNIRREVENKAALDRSDSLKGCAGKF